MKVLITRHGETEENARHICQGQTDGTLSERGKAEARELGKKIAGEKLIACYSSDLGRAVETAKLVLSMRKDMGEGIPLYLDSRLRERYFGSFEGKVFPPYSDEVVPLDEVEPAALIRERLRDFFGELMTLYGSEDTVLVVTHGFTLRVLISLLDGIPLRRLREIATPDNCELLCYTLPFE